VTELVLALDFGGTQLSAAAAERGARAWAGLARVPSPVGASRHTDMELILTAARHVLAGRKPVAVGVSFGGPVNAEAGRVLLSPHIPGWEDVSLRDELQSAFGAPVRVDNDANAAALGEWKFGAGQGAASVLYVTVSTGVGGGWILNGHIWRGADSAAGEIGHIVVQPEGPLCVCGRRGCVEVLAAGPGIARRAREQLMADSADGMVLRKLVNGDLESITAKHVARAADMGDDVALATLMEAARALGLGLSTAITLMNPQRVILGGGVTKSGERWWQAVREAVRANTLGLPPLTMDIRPAALGDDAPLWGAVALVESV
jgi:glucokinase